MVAHQQRVFHGTGGNHESLHQGGGAEEQKDDGDGPFGDETARRFGGFGVGDGDSDGRCRDGVRLLVGNYGFADDPLIIIVTAKVAILKRLFRKSFHT